MRPSIALLLAVVFVLEGCGGSGAGTAKAGPGGGGGPCTTGSCEIGSAGGTVSLSGAPLVEVPDGALAGTTTLTIAASTTPPPAGAISTLYDFGPAGASFATSVTVQLPVAAGTDPALIAGYWTKPVPTDGWDRLPVTVNGTSASFQVSHFSSGYLGCASGAATAASGAPAGVAVAGLATCLDTFTGTSSSLIGDVIPISASVTWVLASNSGTVRQYYAVGTVSVGSWVDQSGCTISYAPASQGISGPNDPAGGGTLTINQGPDPSLVSPTYQMTAVTQWVATVSSSCGGSQPMAAGGVWVRGQGDVTDGGQEISGTYADTASGQTFTYSFLR